MAGARRELAVIEGRCHCGAVRLVVDRAPVEVVSCRCSICRRYGTLCCYYRPAEVRVVAGDGATHRYLWGDRMIAFVRCATCGCVTHWEAVDPTYDRMGVNARMFEPAVVAAAAVREIDGP